MNIRITLISDGPFDRALLPVLRWLTQRDPNRTIAATLEYFDPRSLQTRPGSLSERIAKGIDLYPCDMVVIHRDAEKESLGVRHEEIERALAELDSHPPHVCIVPVRMTEAWLLFDEQAIRRAAGNPNGRTALDLPSIGRCESLPDPKELLENLLRVASGLSGRRLRNLSLVHCKNRVAELIEDFEPLMRLSAFIRFSADFDRGIEQLSSRLSDLS